MRAAIYARYSSDLQRPTSIEDQVRQCQRAADGKGWTVLSEYIRSDAELSGASLDKRDALKSLIADAEKSPRPFDCVLIDDTSRLGRYLPDTLKIGEIFMHYGVFLFFVSQQLDSREKSFRQLQIVNGMLDEQHLVGLADKVHRGQEGRVLKGQIHGGRCYGYRNVPIEDYSHRGEWGRPSVVGVRQVIDPEEAKVIRKMFDLTGEGRSLAAIAKEFNAAGIPAPRPRRDRIQAWSPNGIHSMLRNERYRGRVFWNKTKKIRNPFTRKMQSKKRLKEEWVIVETPELRIVSDEQWEKAHAQIKIKQERFGVQRLGGMNRTQQSTNYLFSGLLICAICGYRMVIVAGTGKTGKYGCPLHRYKGVCPNSLTIRHDRLEDQLIQATVEMALRPDMLEHAILEFNKQLENDAATYLEDRRIALAEKPRLQIELKKLELEAHNLGVAIAQFGIHHSPTLLSQLSSVEDRIATIDNNLQEARPNPPNVPIERIREFVTRQASKLKSLLLGDPAAAKLALQTHFKPLVLSPKDTPDGPNFTVEGGFDLFAGSEDVMLLVAGAGFEPATFGL